MFRRIISGRLDIYTIILVSLRHIGKTADKRKYLEKNGRRIEESNATKIKEMKSRC